MQETNRSQERRSLLRTAMTGTLAAAVAGAAAGTATAADPPAAGSGAPAIRTYDAATSYGSRLAAGPDGAMWSYERLDAGDAGVVIRYGADGVLSRAVAPVRLGVAETPLTPQVDGGMVAVITRWTNGRKTRLRLRADARGERVVATRLPRSAAAADAFAVAADGTVWWADTCANALRRWRPGKRLASVRMAPASCAQPVGASALALGPDGAVWYANANQGRGVRRNLLGRLRQWSFRGAGSWGSSPELAVDPRGGSVAFGVPWGDTAGLVTRAGRFVRTDAGAPAPSTTASRSRRPVADSAAGPSRRQEVAASPSPTSRRRR